MSKKRKIDALDLSDKTMSGAKVDGYRIVVLRTGPELRAWEKKHEEQSMSLHSKVAMDLSGQYKPPKYQPLEVEISGNDPAIEQIAALVKVVSEMKSENDRLQDTIREYRQCVITDVIDHLNHRGLIRTRSSEAERQPSKLDVGGSIPPVCSTYTDGLDEALEAINKCNVDYLFASPVVTKKLEKKKCLHIGRVLRPHIETIRQFLTRERGV